MRKILLLFCALFSNAAIATSLPERFVEVSPGIYRSAQPDLESLSFAQAEFHIKTVINLNNDEDMAGAEVEWAKQLKIHLISEPMSGFWAPEDSQIDEILAAIDNPNNLPMLVHCQHGQDRTGLVIGLHRVLHEHWAPERAYNEMLDRGFHTILLGLDSYFHSRTGWEFSLP